MQEDSKFEAILKLHYMFKSNLNYSKTLAQEQNAQLSVNSHIASMH